MYFITEPSYYAERNNCDASIVFVHSPWQSAFSFGSNSLYVLTSLAASEIYQKLITVEHFTNKYVTWILAVVFCCYLKKVTSTYM